MIWKCPLEACKYFSGPFDENRVVDYQCDSCQVPCQNRKWIILGDFGRFLASSGHHCGQGATSWSGNPLPRPKNFTWGCLMKTEWLVTMCCCLDLQYTWDCHRITGTSEARIQLMPSKWSDQYTRCLFFVHFVVVFQVSVIAIHAFWLMYPSTTCYLTHDVDLTWFDCVCLIWSFIFELFMNNQQGVSAKHQCCSCTHLSQTAHFKHSHVWTYLNN